MKRHYTDKDFYITSVTEPQNNGYGCQQGYCKVCGGDMQRFWDKNKWGFVRHYNSHKSGGIKKPIPKQTKQLTALERILSS